MPQEGDVNRRTFIKGAGTAAAGASLAGKAAAEKTDDSFEEQDGLLEAIVIFRSRDDVDRLDDLSLAEGYYKFKALPYGYTKITLDQLTTIASWPEVVYVQDNHEVECKNSDAREATNAQAVQRSQYTGESVHVAVIDSGVDGDHPGLIDNLEHNFRFGSPLHTDMWTDVGPVNTGSSGHGTHVAGSVASHETPVNTEGDDWGMAPDASLTVYSTSTAPPGVPDPTYVPLGLLGIVGAYDDLIARQREGEMDVQIVNNSYGANAGADYNPTAALQYATWEAYREGMLSVFSAGNAGPDPNTMGNYAAGPHIMSSAATHDDTRVTDFSSRGRAPSYEGGGDGANYDRRRAFNQVNAYFENGPFVSEETEVGSGSASGTLGVAGRGMLPGLVDDALPETPESPVTGSEFFELEAPAEATLISITFGWTPQGADNDLYLRKGAPDGEVVASSTGFVDANPESITEPIEGGETYYIELRPWLNAVSEYEMQYSFYNVPEERIPERPFGVHRPAVGTPGNMIMSTMAPEDPLQTYAGYAFAAGASSQENAEETAQEPFYAEVSGTSMSAPVLSGCAALVFDAYRQEHLEWPDPIDVINTIEATAVHSHEEHKPHNIGAGFVDIHAAVERAKEGDLASFDEVELVGGSVDEDADRVGTTDKDDRIATGGD